MSKGREDWLDREDEKIEDPLHFLLHRRMRGIFEAEEVLEGDHIYIPEWKLTIRPHVAQWSEQSVMLQFHLSSPKWDRDIYETSAGIGSGAHNALGMAIGGFAFTLMQGIASMEKDRNPDELHTTYGDTAHRWKVYKSDIIGVGESSADMRNTPYWETLKDGIAKRVGNQKLCYIKIYGAKNGDTITGECRINNIPSPELGQIVAEMAGKWQVEGFASQKQFIFLLQSEETYSPYPYRPIKLPPPLGQRLICSWSAIRRRSMTNIRTGWLSACRMPAWHRSCIPSCRKFVRSMPSIRSPIKRNYCCSGLKKLSVFIGLSLPAII